MKKDLETFKSLAKKLGYEIVKKEQKPKFKPRTITTKTSHKWTEVKLNTWKDEESRLIWYDNVLETLNWQQALGEAKELKLELPKASDFMVMVEHGGLEVLPNFKDKCFWSSSPYPHRSGYAFLFNGFYGYVVNDVRAFKYSVRCVGR